MLDRYLETLSKEASDKELYDEQSKSFEETSTVFVLEKDDVQVLLSIDQYLDHESCSLGENREE